LSASAGSNNPFTDVIISSTEPYKKEKKTASMKVSIVLQIINAVQHGEINIGKASS
jgi:hypothetical protein